MAITLQSTVGGFSPEFMRKLPSSRTRCSRMGWSHREFVISKDRASPDVPWIGPFFYQYTVFIGEENFTVTEPNDISSTNIFTSAASPRPRRCIRRSNARAVPA